MTNSRRNRLVLADDNPDVVHAIKDMLATEFEIVGTASDGETVLRIIPELDPDLIVLDITMPGISGLETAYRLKRRGGRARVVFLTVHNDADYVREAQSAGMSGYVTKSNMAIELPRAIREALAGGVFISPCIKMDDPSSRIGGDAG